MPETDSPKLFGRSALSGAARVAGVIGWPIAHSLSPRLHGFWLDRHRVDGVYVPLAVKPGMLGRALIGLSALGFAGANVTIPHKEDACALVDEVSDLALRIGAVNTIVVRSDGRLFGTNTDAFGFIANLEAGCPGWRADAGPAVLLGAGGAARAIAVALIEAAAPALVIVNRDQGRAERLAAKLGPAGVRVEPWAKRAEVAGEAALLVNATSLGMAGKPPLDIDLAALPGEAVVTDIVYAPLVTPLLAAAGARGNRTVDGLGMLLHQARPAFQAWFGIDPEVSPELRRHVEQGLRPS
ncbi:MAG: shikimate dehydrogenase [Rhodospirillales bacterium]|nr:shikimate dehydrogenase [Rhodospirillales bacterium]